MRLSAVLDVAGFEKLKAGTLVLADKEGSVDLAIGVPKEKVEVDVFNLALWAPKLKEGFTAEIITGGESKPCNVGVAKVGTDGALGVPSISLDFFRLTTGTCRGRCGIFDHAC